MKFGDSWVRVLSIDGGGIRGIIPLSFLVELEKETGRKSHELFDLISGTSTGGIVALGLTRPKPLSAREILDLYIDLGPKIFKRNLTTTFRWAFFPKYGPKFLEAFLQERIGNYPIYESIVPTLITSYDLEYGRPRLFRSWVRERAAAWKIGRATSAAPTYFRPYKGLIDGGIVANNTSLIAALEAQKVYVNREINLVSLGTGEVRARKLPRTLHNVYR